ncbi:root hair defective 3 GTP-binding protein-domain-containing protein [Thamnocephalis sphaerospora]|uniref:Root hair defective 3 GTP-binding protein-domain-containing protein n=1 Tax=Thamnocephalis sphaerospora TaxID=78915 RepID=A0A4V1IX73_9FUNG|nr:root hair defective 3 GTP-binding protein-domain-containing protein [Thamnocephalis sphaerospora]|eukprot:RKP10059.1 root hair defective 3 GTP-binding protein-domain-containing protein [Thamnocephalis sphaerospora]
MDDTSTIQLTDGLGPLIDTSQHISDDWGLAGCELDYHVVAVCGSPCTGKSTLLDALFGTNFSTTGAASGQPQMERGIWMGKCAEANILVMDVKNVDSQEHDQDKPFERRNALFSLATAEVLVVSMYEATIGLYNRANIELFKTVFEANLRLSEDNESRKTLLFFAVRDYTGQTPLHFHESKLRENMTKIWGNVAKPESLENSSFSDFFDCTVAGLPPKPFVPDQFDEAVDRLRLRFTDPNDSSYVFKPCYHRGIPIDGFSRYASGIWAMLTDEMLSISVQQMLLAGHHCMDLFPEAEIELEQSISAIKAQIDDGEVVDGLGSLMENACGEVIAMFDAKVKHYQHDVCKEMRGRLYEALCEKLTPLIRIQLRAVAAQISDQFVDKIEPLRAGSIAEFIESSKEMISDSLDDFEIMINDMLINGMQSSFDEERNDLSEDLFKTVEQYCEMNSERLAVEEEIRRQEEENKQRENEHMEEMCRQEEEYMQRESEHMEQVRKQEKEHGKEAEHMQNAHGQEANYKEMERAEWKCVEKKEPERTAILATLWTTMVAYVFSLLAHLAGSKYMAEMAVESLECQDCAGVVFRKSDLPEARLEQLRAVNAKQFATSRQVSSEELRQAIDAWMDSSRQEGEPKGGRLECVINPGNKSGYIVFPSVAIASRSVERGIPLHEGVVYFGEIPVPGITDVVILDCQLATENEVEEALHAAMPAMNVEIVSLRRRCATDGVYEWWYGTWEATIRGDADDTPSSINLWVNTMRFASLLGIAIVAALANLAQARLPVGTAPSVSYELGASVNNDLVNLHPRFEIVQPEGTLPYFETDALGRQTGIKFRTANGTLIRQVKAYRFKNDQIDCFYFQDFPSANSPAVSVGDIMVRYSLMRQLPVRYQIYKTGEYQDDITIRYGFANNSNEITRRPGNGRPGVRVKGAVPWNGRDINIGHVSQMPALNF